MNLRPYVGHQLTSHAQSRKVSEVSDREERVAFQTLAFRKKPRDKKGSLCMVNTA